MKNCNKIIYIYFLELFNRKRLLLFFKIWAMCWFETEFIAFETGGHNLQVFMRRLQPTPNDIKYHNWETNILYKNLWNHLIANVIAEKKLILFYPSFATRGSGSLNAKKSLRFPFPCNKEMLSSMRFHHFFVIINSE